MSSNHALTIETGVSVSNAIKYFSIGNVSFSGMTESMSEAYIHGTSSAEHGRLVAQAHILAPAVFGGLDFSADTNLVELGCGTGAEGALLLQAYPDLQWTGIDQDSAQLAGATALLEAAGLSNRATLLQRRAEETGLSEGTADVVLIVWLLEHVADATPILEEAMRILRPGGRLIAVEVQNTSFRVEPAEASIDEWWGAFLAFQRAHGGTPEIGEMLPTYFSALDVEAYRVEHLQPVDTFLTVGRRAEFLTYMEDLLLSAADSFQSSRIKNSDDADALKAAFQRLRAHPQGHIQYHAVRATAWKS